MAKDGWHWYWRHDGKPCYEIAGRTGDMRPPTMRDAKKGIKGILEPYSIVPSVTSIVKAIGTPPGLVAWMVRTTIECAATNPCKPGETADAYAARLACDTERTRNEAARLGTEVHNYLEMYCRSGKVPQTNNAEVARLAAPTIAWLDANLTPVSVEKSFAADAYGGKLDLYAIARGAIRSTDGDDECHGYIVVDFKTQAAPEKYGYQPRVYDEWGEQLEAYAEGFGGLCDGIVSIVINTVTPRPPFIHVWGDRERLAKMWGHKLAYFRLSHEWNPPERQQ